MINKKHTSWKKIIVKALIAVTFILANFGVTIAQDDARSQYKSFDVKKYLTVNDQNNYSTGSQEHKYLDSTNPFGTFILQAVNLVALTAASLSFLAVVISGFLMITAAGNENQVNKAKEILQRAIIGLVITLSAYFIVSFVQNLLFETAGT